LAADVKDPAAWTAASALSCRMVNRLEKLPLIGASNKNFFGWTQHNKISLAGQIEALM
jgi:hypothetical protein